MQRLEQHQQRQPRCRSPRAMECQRIGAEALVELKVPLDLYRHAPCRACRVVSKRFFEPPRCAVSDNAALLRR